MPKHGKKFREALEKIDLVVAELRNALKLDFEVKMV
jgi:hypothetical protein